MDTSREPAPSFSSVLQSIRGGTEQQELQVTTTTAPKKAKSATTTTRSSIPTCAKETHALWACRSVCLGCAEHLRNVKDCFQLVPPQILETPQTSYEPTSYTGVIPCRELQQELGKCVITQAKELQQRLNREKDNDDGGGGSKKEEKE